MSVNQTDTDPSGGASDAFTLAIAHACGKRLVLDVCRAVRPPFDPSQVTAEFSQLLKQYGCYTVQGDRYSAEWVVAAFRSHGIHYQQSERTKSEIYLEIVPQFATGAVQLLDIRTLITELRQLERRTARGGRDIVDHPPRGHDDLANAACGALFMVSRKSAPIDMATQSYVPTVDELRGARDSHLREIGMESGNLSPWTDAGFVPSPWDLN